jgi:hypothetical protein
MPTNRYANVTEELVRWGLAQPGAFFEPEGAQVYSEMFPNLAEQLAPWMPRTRPAATPGAATPIPGGTPTTTVDGTTSGGGGSTDPNAFSQLFPGRPGGDLVDEQINRQIQELLNPPAVFTDVSRRAAEVGAGRGISGSEAAFGTGLRMTDEERLRRQTMGQELLTSREESDRAYQGLANQARELDLKEQQIKADIALGNRTAANQEALTAIQQQRVGIEAQLAQLERDKLALERRTAQSHGVGTGTQQINIAGTGFPENWVTYDPATGRYR